MKYRKSAVIATIVLATGLSTAAVLVNSNPPSAKPVASIQARQEKTMQKDTTTPPETAPVAPTQAVAAPVAAPPANTADQNRAQLQAAITAKAIVIGTAVKAANINGFANIQWACVDKMVSATVGYADYTVAENAPSAQYILAQPDGSAGSYSYYQDLGTCRLITSPVQP